MREIHLDLFVDVLEAWYWQASDIEIENTPYKTILWTFADFDEYFSSI